MCRFVGIGTPSEFYGSTMRVGVVYPQIELGGDPEALKRIGLAVEEMGYDHLLMYDHVVGVEHADREPPLAGPYTEHDPFHDPLVAFSYLSGLTERLKFMTGVLLLPQRQTFIVAKQATDVDLVSGGRLTLGVGSGWNYVEYGVLGQSWKDRGAHLDEQIPLLRQLWSEPLVTVQGQFEQMERCALVPRPKRSIPIYCGGSSEPAFRRAARLADGFIWSANMEDALRGWARVQEHLRLAGRPVEGFGSHYVAMEGGFDGVTWKWAGVDPPAAVATVDRWRETQGTAISFHSMGRGLSTADAHIEYFADIKRRLDAQ